MTKRLIILTFIAALTSCGPRSGISKENKEPATCCVTEETNGISSPLSESQLKGKVIFDSQCKNCHPIDGHAKCSNMMRGVCDRIPNYDWFKFFVQHSDSLKKSGDGYANKIDEEWQSNFEHNFKELSAEDIKDIYNYLSLW